MKKTKRPKALGMHRVPLLKVTVFEILWLASTVSIFERAGWISIDYFDVPKDSIWNIVHRNFRFILFILTEVVRYSWEYIIDIILFIFRYDLSWVSITIYHAFLFFCM